MAIQLSGGTTGSANLAVTASDDGDGKILFTTSSDHGLVDGNEVTFSNSSGSSMPGNITTSTTFYVLNRDVARKTFQVTTRKNEPTK